MRSPGCIKDVQRLTGRLTALSRFLGASAAKALPFFALMKKGIAFEWTPACEEAFNHFKEILAAPPVLGKPKAKEPLYLYLATTEGALAAVLVREEGKAQQPIYFVSRALQGAELRYSKLEKLALALLVSFRQLRYNGRLAGGGNRESNRSHEHTVEAPCRRSLQPDVWGHRDYLRKPGRSHLRTVGQVRVSRIEQPSRIRSPPGGLVLAQEVGATRLEVCSDSQVVTSQVNGSYQARDSLLQKYLKRVKELSKQFEEITIQHVPRERNTRADLLSKLASTKPRIGNCSLIQGITKEPAVALHLTKISPSWMDPITDFLESGKLPEDEKEAKALRREAVKYTVIQDQLFKKGLSQFLLKCLHPDQTDYVITRFGILEIVISDNGTQFTDKKFAEFLTGLGIKQKFSSVEHPQTNGQVESANKVILLGLKKRLDSKKEIGEPSPRLLLAGVEKAVDKDLVDEVREMAHLSEVALKQRIALRYNTKVLRREFEERDLVLRRNDVGQPTPGEGKLAANWECPYRIKEVLGKGAYKLERLDSKEIPRTWNAGNLRRFYS
ncbi:uncharacterized protein [Arachis hypogaea]|uniref:uncharacterized protein n=1 Tax=Arachis hypogaea TaxID=3818 RepID=UPI003B2169D9